MATSVPSSTQADRKVRLLQAQTKSAMLEQPVAKILGGSQLGICSFSTPPRYQLIITSDHTAIRSNPPNYAQ
ncbi:hypothetical protein MESS4_360044 [Mesorhizobium sp. STM 4661]|nr:hypothetical protein MESS4_360044 [Mesorhizobium sp. STM 4661]